MKTGLVQTEWLTDTGTDMINLTSKQSMCDVHRLIWSKGESRGRSGACGWREREHRHRSATSQAGEHKDPLKDTCHWGKQVLLNTWFYRHLLLRISGYAVLHGNNSQHVCLKALYIKRTYCNYTTVEKRQWRKQENLTRAKLWCWDDRVSKTAARVGSRWSAVVNDYQKGNRQGTVVKQH